jgi:uncharacterized protein YegJ (DUF2314 family)
MRAAPGLSPRAIARLSRRIDIAKDPHRRRARVAENGELRVNPGAAADILLIRRGPSKGFADPEALDLSWLPPRPLPFARLQRSTWPRMEFIPSCSCLGNQDEDLTMRIASPALAPLAVAMMLSVPSHVLAQSVPEKIERDETYWVKSDDPDMVAAKRKARETLPEFLALARTPRNSTSKFAVKVAIRDKGIAEFFWITHFVEKDGRFSGQIDNEPDSVANVKLGDTISFGEEEIVDWLYLDGTRLKGNFTMCVLLKHSPRPEAVIKRYGLDCNF